MRSGAPDALDIMVAVTYAHCAMDLIGRKEFGRMVALCEGRYTHVQADSPLLAEKKVDVAALYDEGAFRPLLRHGLGMPMFLY
jgi:6-phosphofructokinase 1